MEPASLDLVEIIEFISHDRPSAARELGRAILLAGRRLSRNPGRGKLVPELLEHGLSDYRQVIISSYRLIYAILGTSVDIVAVLDGRRDFQHALLQRLLR